MNDAHLIEYLITSATWFLAGVGLGHLLGGRSAGRRHN